MYLCVPCYCDACLKFSALRVGMKTLHNTIHHRQFARRTLPQPVGDHVTEQRITLKATQTFGKACSVLVLQHRNSART